MYEYGIGRAMDLARAREFYERGCTPTDYIACGRVGHFYEYALGGALVDLPRAEASYQRACDSDVPMPEACRALAALYGRTGGADAARIAELEQRAFDAAKAMADSNPYYQYVLGTYYRDGVATMKSPEEAARLFVQACEGYDPIGCLAGGDLYLAHEGMTKNAALAASLFQRACAAKVQAGCDRAANAKSSSAALPLSRKKGGCACRTEATDGTDLLGSLALAVASTLIGFRKKRRS
jgi:TPR repeat protein